MAKSLRHTPLIVSLHDIEPATEMSTRKWCRILDGWGIKRRSLAVIPCSGGKSLHTCISLVEFLRGEIVNGAEIIQHGFTHQHPSPYTLWHHRLYNAFIARGNAEFFRPVPGVAVAQWIEKGRKELENTLGVEVRGFTAPCWAQDRGVEKVLRQQGYAWYDTMGGIVDLKRRCYIRAPVITGTPADNLLGSMFMPIYGFQILPYMFRGLTRRVALHPYDLSNSRFMRYVEKYLLTWTQRHLLSSYAEVLL